MAGDLRSLEFSEGVAVDAPTQSALESRFNNVGLSIDVDGSNNMDIALTQRDGTTPSAAGPCEIGFRSATQTSGVNVVREVTSSITLEVPSGATIGALDATATKYYVYAIDNAGTVELAVCRIMLDEAIVHTTVAIDATADSNNVLYSTTLRSNIAIRLLGFWEATQATAGTHATSPTTVFVGQPEFELVKAIYSSDSGQTVNGNTQTVINFEDLDLDTHGSVTIGAGWKFTALRDMTVTASGGIKFAQASWNANEPYYGYIKKNGSTSVAYFEYEANETALTTDHSLYGAATVDLAKDDYIQYVVYQNSGGNINLPASADLNHFSVIEQV